MPPKMSEEHADYRKEQILMATWECFAEKGYHDTTMRDISRVSKLSTGAIYNYFKGKDEILEALHKWGLEQKKIAFGLIALKDTAREALDEFFELVLSSFDSSLQKKIIRGDINLWSEGLRREYLREIFEIEIDDMKQKIAEIIRSGIEGDEIRDDVDPESLASVIIGTLLGLQVQSVLIPDFDTRGFLKQFNQIMFDDIWLNQGGGK